MQCNYFKLVDMLNALELEFQKKVFDRLFNVPFHVELIIAKQNPTSLKWTDSSSTL